MDNKVFEITSAQIWKLREEWIDKTIEELEVGSYLVSGHIVQGHGFQLWIRILEKLNWETIE